MCGRTKDLPKIEGTPYALDKRSAKDFALRRARRGFDADEEGVTEHLEEVIRYGDKPVTIDPETGHVKPYRRK